MHTVDPAVQKILNDGDAACVGLCFRRVIILHIVVDDRVAKVSAEQLERGDRIGCLRLAFRIGLGWSVGGHQYEVLIVGTRRLWTYPHGPQSPALIFNLRDPLGCQVCVRRVVSCPRKAYLVIIIRAVLPPRLHFGGAWSVALIEPEMNLRQRAGYCVRAGPASSVSRWQGRASQTGVGPDRFALWQRREWRVRVSAGWRYVGP